MQPWESWQRDALTLVVMIAFAIVGTMIVVYIVHEVQHFIQTRTTPRGGGGQHHLFH